METTTTNGAERRLPATTYDGAKGSENDPVTYACVSDAIDAYYGPIFEDEDDSAVQRLYDDGVLDTDDLEALRNYQAEQQEDQR